MTTRSEWQHRVAETKTRMATKLAGYLFSTKTTPTTRLVKKLMKADRDAQYEDPDLEHPAS